MPEPDKTTHEVLLERISTFQEGVETFIKNMDLVQSEGQRMFQVGMFVRFCNEYLTSIEKIVRNDVPSSPSTETR